MRNPGGLAQRKRRAHRSAAGAIDHADTRERLTQQGATTVGNNPAEFAAFINSERAQVTDLVKRAGLMLED